MAADWSSEGMDRFKESLVRIPGIARYIYRAFERPADDVLAERASKVCEVSPSAFQVGSEYQKVLG
jgi:hypothetical protein